MFRDLIEYFVIAFSGKFDKSYYLLNNPDVRQADVNAIMHYIKTGWKEGRNPSALFTTNFYLDKNPDINAAGINPLFHYIRHGKKEGRVINDQQEELRGRSIIRNSNNFELDFLPLVSIIVPNYNHADFLDQRLQSIYNQTYKNIEVILLDDCSKDDSAIILKKYSTRYKKNTRLFINSTNSGNTFLQWKKGMSYANGDLVWIAESDDYCEPDLIEKLVPFFSDESIMLAYAHSIFIDEKGNPSAFAYENYLSEINTNYLHQPYIRTGHQEVNTALGIKNSIPNASAVIFRKPNKDFSLLNDEAWINMKVCGDWIFYLELLKGGKLAYSNETHNFFRFHSGNASSKTHTQKIYYQEHERVARWIANYFHVKTNVLTRNHDIIKNYYKKNIWGKNSDNFSALYNINNIIDDVKNRNPNVLIVIFGFLLGGGEILPIHLANELRKKGGVITILNFGYGERNQGVRKLLHPQIPVINYYNGMDLRKIVEDFNIECIHTHHASMENLIAKSEISKNSNISHIATMHGMYEMMEKNDEEIITNNQSVDHWCYIAEKNLIPFKRLGLYNPKKFTKVNNGIPEIKITPINRENYGIFPDSFVFCLASRALISKGWYEAIEAVKIARKRTKRDLHLLLIGDGDVYDQLTSESLPEFIHLLGFKNNVLDFFASSDAILLPSYYKGESVPLVIIESLYCGKPVIASNIGEVENMLSVDGDNKAGILISLKENIIDQSELINEIINISEDKSLYSELANNTKKIIKNFKIDPIADKYLSIYQKVINRKSS